MKKLLTILLICSPLLFWGQATPGCALPTATSSSTASRIVVYQGSCTASAGKSMSIAQFISTFSLAQTSGIVNMTVTISGGGIVVVAGVFPNFTITAVESQTLSIAGYVISLSGGSSITLPAETQSLTVTSNSLSISPSSYVAFAGANTNTVTTASGVVTIRGASNLSSFTNGPGYITTPTITINSGNAVQAASSAAVTYTFQIATLPGLYRTIYVPAAAMVARVIAGASGAVESYTTNAIMSEYYAFVSTASVSVQFQHVMPDEWDLGTIKVKVYWATISTSVTGTAWGIRGGAIANAGAIDAALGTEIYVTDANNIANGLNISAASGAITIGGTPALSKLCVFNVARITSDSFDDLASDAKLLGIEIQYKELTTVPAIW